MAASRRPAPVAGRPTLPPNDVAAAPTLPRPQAAPPLSRDAKRRHERLAWLVMLACFAAFLVIVIGGPLATVRFLRTAMVARTAELEVIRPIVLVRTAQGGQTGVTDIARVEEEQTIVTDNESRALLTLFDGSTVQIYPSTELRLTRLREPRFAKYGLSHGPNDIALEVISGTAKVGVALPIAGRTAPQFFVTSPHMTAHLVEGGYFFDVSSSGTDVHAYNFDATVIGAATNEAVTVHRGQHTQVPAEGAPLAATTTEVNLLTNGDFSAPLGNGWRVILDQGGDGPSVDPEWDVENTGDRQALRFTRSGSMFAPDRGNHANVRAVQILGRNLPDPYTSLRLRAEVRVNEQSLSGGGYLDSEYPMILRVVYKDAYGSEHEWWRGFYIQNEAGNPTAHGDPLRRGVWTPVEFELRQSDLPPFQIVRVEAQASGWDFDAEVSDIRLTVR